MEMDNINIGSKLMVGLIEKIIKRSFRKKLGVSADIHINDPVTLVNDGEKTKIHLNVDAEIDKIQLNKLIQSII